MAEFLSSVNFEIKAEVYTENNRNKEPYSKNVTQMLNWTTFVRSENRLMKYKKYITVLNIL